MTRGEKGEITTRRIQLTFTEMGLTFGATDLGLLDLRCLLDMEMDRTCGQKGVCLQFGARIFLWI
jgi:hypothetical protein